MVISHFTWLLKKMAMPMEFSCLTAMQWVRKPSLYFLNVFYFYGHCFANILFSSPILRCDVPANPCPDIPHHWRNSRLLHGFGPNTRTCCSGVHCSRILTLLQTNAGFCLLGWFVLFSPTHHKYSFFIFSWLADRSCHPTGLWDSSCAATDTGMTQKSPSWWMKCRQLRFPMYVGSSGLLSSCLNV